MRKIIWQYIFKTWKKCNEISVNKKQNTLEQIENEKHKSLARARASLLWGCYYPKQQMNYLHNLLHLKFIHCLLGGTSRRKDDFVYKTKFRHVIKNILWCIHTSISMFISRYSIDVKTKNMCIGD